MQPHRVGILLLSLASCAPRVAVRTQRPRPVAHVPAARAAATDATGVERCEGRRGAIDARWGPLVWSHEPLERPVDRERFVAAGHRVLRDAGPGLCVSNQRLAAEFSAISRVRDGWLFLTTDGLLTFARTFTGPLERVAEVSIDDGDGEQAPLSVQRGALAWIDRQRRVWIATDAGGARRAAEIALGDEPIKVRCDCEAQCEVETASALRYVSRDRGARWLGPFEPNEQAPSACPPREPSPARSTEAPSTSASASATDARWAEDVARSPALRAAIARAPDAAALHRWGDGLALVQHRGGRRRITRFTRDEQGRWSEDADAEVPGGMSEQLRFASDGRSLVGAGDCVDGIYRDDGADYCVLRLERPAPVAWTVRLTEAPTSVHLWNDALLYALDGQLRARDLRTGRTRTLARWRGARWLSLEVGADRTLTVFELDEEQRPLCVRRSQDGARWTECAPLPQGARSASFADARSGVAVGRSFDELWRTRDGVSWSAIELPLDGARRAIAAPTAWCEDGACYVGPWWLSDADERAGSAISAQTPVDSTIREPRRERVERVVQLSLRVSNGAQLYRARTVNEGPRALWTGVGRTVELAGPRGDLWLRWGDQRASRWRGEAATPEATVILLAVGDAGLLFAFADRREPGVTALDAPLTLHWGPHGGEVRALGAMHASVGWVAVVDDGPVLLESSGRVRRFDRAGALVDQRVVRGADGIARRGGVIGVVREELDGAWSFVDLRGSSAPWLRAIAPPVCDRRAMIAGDWIVARAELRVRTSEQYLIAASPPLAWLAVRDGAACIARVTAEGTWDELAPPHGWTEASPFSDTHDAAIELEPDPARPRALRVYDHARALELRVSRWSSPSP